MRLYLASTSPARLATLRATGIEPITVPSHVDEEAAVISAGVTAPAEMVLLLARLKAEAVATALSDDPTLDGLVLGGDSAFEFDGQAYGKPHLPETARTRWRAQRGGSGVLHSGHWVIDARGGRIGAAVGAAAAASVHFASTSATPRSTRTSPPGNRSRSPAPSPSTRAVRRSSSGSRAIRTPSSDSACRWCGCSSAGSGSSGPTSGTSPSDPQPPVGTTQHRHPFLWSADNGGTSVAA